MASDTVNSICAFAVLLILPVDLWLLSLFCADCVQRMNSWPIRIQPRLFSLNFAYAYLTIDAIVSVAICLSLYHLTYTGEAKDISASALAARWGGITLIMSYCVFEFPAKPIIKLLWPVLVKWKNRPRGLDEIDGIDYATTSDLLVPWAEGMGDSANWVGLCIVGGAVTPYVGIMTILWMLDSLKVALGLSGIAMRIFDLFSLLSDWWGAFVILALMLNLLALSFPDLTVGQIFSNRKEQQYE